MQLGPLRFRHLVFLAGLALVPPVGLLVGLALVTPITSSGLGYTLGVVLVMFGALGVVWKPRPATFAIVVGLAVMTTVAGIRLATGAEAKTVKLVTLPDGGETRWIDRLIHERDLALFGQHAAFLTGFGLSWREHDGLAAALTSAYRSLDEVGGTTSSPTFATYTFQQWPDHFDAVIVDPPEGKTAQSAVIYLHGFGGNFAVQGWLIGQAARRIDALTVCPSVGFIGNWWSPWGEKTVRTTIAYLRKRGIRRMYLAGLSNGAVGTCRLAGRLRNDLAGLILISGADPHATTTDLPVIALQGADDQRMHADSTRRYIERTGKLGTYHEFDGDHVLLAKRAVEVQDALVEWLQAQEAQSH